MVDTLASGASGGNPVEVRVLFSVPSDSNRDVVKILDIAR